MSGRGIKGSASLLSFTYYVDTFYYLLAYFLDIIEGYIASFIASFIELLSSIEAEDLGPRVRVFILRYLSYDFFTGPEDRLV